MIADAASYVTSRIAEGAAESIGPKLAWGAGVLLLAIAALVFGFSAAHSYLSAIYGSLDAALAIAGACLVLLIFLIVVPWVFGRARRATAVSLKYDQSALEAVDEEAKDVIDYFGAAKVMATAFMFGFSAARRIKR